MINHLVGIGKLSQGFAFVTLLPARFFARTFAQTLHSRRGYHEQVTGQDQAAPHVPSAKHP